MDIQETTREYLRENWVRIRPLVEQWKTDQGKMPGIILLSAHGQRSTGQGIALVGKSDMPSLLLRLKPNAVAQEIRDRHYGDDDCPIVVEVPGNTMRTSWLTWQMSEEFRAMGVQVRSVNMGRATGVVRRFKQRDRRTS